MKVYAWPTRRAEHSEDAATPATLSANATPRQWLEHEHMPTAEQDRIIAAHWPRKPTRAQADAVDSELPAGAALPPVTANELAAATESAYQRGWDEGERHGRYFEGVFMWRWGVICGTPVGALMTAIAIKLGALLGGA